MFPENEIGYIKWLVGVLLELPGSMGVIFSIQVVGLKVYLCQVLCLTGGSTAFLLGCYPKVG